MYTHDEIQKLEEHCMILESAVDDALYELGRGTQYRSWITVDEVIEKLEAARTKIHAVEKDATSN